MSTQQLIVELLEGFVLLGLFIFAVYLRAMGREETRRARSQASSIEQRLVRAIEEASATAEAATTRVAEDLAETDALAKDAQSRLREAELGLARIEPKLDHLTQRLDNIGERVDRCATRDDIARLSGLVERFGARVERLAGALEESGGKGKDGGRLPA